MANMLEMMREYKALRAAKAAGTLSSVDKERLREVAAYLKGAMANRQQDGDAAKPSSSPPPIPPRQAAPVASPPPIPVTAPQKPHWQQQAEDQAERQKRAQSQFQVAIPSEIAEYQPSASTETPEEKTDPSIDSRFIEPSPKRAKPRNPEEALAQLNEIQAASSYERSFDELQTEYYYSYLDEGYALVEGEEEEDIELDPIDPRELELQKAGLASSSGTSASGNITITKAPGGLFLDEFMILYDEGILPRPDEDLQPEFDDPNALVPGKRKVTLHLLNGQVRRGTVEKILRGDLGFSFTLDKGAVEDIAFVHIKALFIMKGRADPPDLSNSAKISVEFHDRRRVQGLSPDYQPGVPVFTLVPSGSGNFERVLINAAAAKSVS